MIYNRLKVYLNHKNIAVSKLERNIGASIGTISRAIKNGTDIQSKWIVSILENLPDLNPCWLILGEEPMLRDGTLNPIPKETSQFELLQKENIFLKKEVKLKDEIISLLKEKQQT